MIEVRVHYKDSSDKQLTFDKEQVFFGKHPANDVPLNNSAVGLRHARLCRYRGHWWVEDLKSPTGTRVNGESLASPRVVEVGDRIEIGEFRVQVLRIVLPQVGAGPAPTPTPVQERAPVPAPSPSFVAPQETVRKPPVTQSSPGQTTLVLSSAPPQNAYAQPSGYEPASTYAPAPGPAPASTGLGQGYGAEMPAGNSYASAEAAPVERKLSWYPPQPAGIDETGLRRTVIVDLILKSIYFAGEISGLDLREQLKLPYDILEPVISELRRDKLLDMKGGGGGFGSISMVYFITNKGTENIRQTLDRNRYIGPAPITMDDYLKAVNEQSIRRIKIPKRRLQTAFGHLIIDDYIYDGIGPALNSGTAILFYGPPGNGKTAICQGMVNTLGEGIYIPYAIEADGNIIKVFDEHNHKPMPRPEGSIAEYDQRYVFCQRPLMMVGGELTLDMLDMSYSTDAKYYEAPFQMKANGGILLIDDFGRQKVAPKDLLNRWIVPLESQIDFISLVTGRKLKVPFDVFVAFATNLNPDDLVDDAFLRRVRYKLEVKRPDLDLFKKLFQLTCKSQKVPFDDAGFGHLVGLYQRDRRPMNACEPRNIVSAIVSLSDYFERPAVMETELIDRAYQGYFTRFQPVPE